MLKLCAWGVHLYTAMGAVAGLIALDCIARGDFRGAFCRDGRGRLHRFQRRTTGPRNQNPRANSLAFDGAMLDNIVDYLTYVIAPVFLMLRREAARARPYGFIVAALCRARQRLRFLSRRSQDR